MAVADSGYKLLKEEASLHQDSNRSNAWEERNNREKKKKKKKGKFKNQDLILTKASCIAYTLKELSSGCIFHYNCKMGSGQDDLHTSQQYPEVENV